MLTAIFPSGKGAVRDYLRYVRVLWWIIMKLRQYCWFPVDCYQLHLWFFPYFVWRNNRRPKYHAGAGHRHRSPKIYHGEILCQYCFLTSNYDKNADTAPKSTCNFTSIRTSFDGLAISWERKYFSGVEIFGTAQWKSVGCVTAPSPSDGGFCASNQTVAY